MRRQGRFTEDSDPDKDQYLIVNWRNMCITSGNAKFIVPPKLLLTGLKISLNCIHLYWGFRSIKPTDENLSHMKTGKPKTISFCMCVCVYVCMRVCVYVYIFFHFREQSFILPENMKNKKYPLKNMKNLNWKICFFFLLAYNFRKWINAVVIVKHGGICLCWESRCGRTQTQKHTKSINHPTAQNERKICEDLAMLFL